jgi:hypothetical protein
MKSNFDQIHAHPAMKLGVVPRSAGRRVCALENYLDLSKFPTTPVVLDWQTAAPQAVQLFANDRIGDCAVAGYLHFKETVAANAGHPMTFADPADAITLYTQATGALNGQRGGAYDPADPEDTDNGLVLVDFLDWQMQRGDILAHAEVNFKNEQLLRLSRWLFGGIYWAFNLPEAAQTMKFTWDKPSVFNLGDPAPGSWGGHCVNDETHDDDGNCTVTSWGRRIQVTPCFRQIYGLEAHVIITKEWFAAQGGTAPCGFSLADLQSDLQQIQNA